MLTVAAAATACARPGNTPGGTPAETSRALHASAVVVRPDADPVPRVATGAARRPGLAPCAQPPEPIAKPVPSRARGATAHPRGAGPNDAGPPPAADPAEAEQRRRQVLDAQQSPPPRRGVVAPGAATGAEQCIAVLRQELALRTAGADRAPGEADIRAALEGAGLTRPVVRPGPRFAASTGEACVLGTFTGGTAAFTIAALPADGSCRP